MAMLHFCLSIRGYKKYKTQLNAFPSLWVKPNVKRVHVVYDDFKIAMNSFFSFPMRPLICYITVLCLYVFHWWGRERLHRPNTYFDAASQLKLSTLGKIFCRWYIEIFFLIFTRKQDLICPLETICIKCQILLFFVIFLFYFIFFFGGGGIKKNITSLSSA